MGKVLHFSKILSELNIFYLKVTTGDIIAISFGIASTILAALAVAYTRRNRLQAGNDSRNMYIVMRANVLGFRRY